MDADTGRMQSTMTEAGERQLGRRSAQRLGPDYKLNANREERENAVRGEKLQRRSEMVWVAKGRLRGDN